MLAVPRRPFVVLGLVTAVATALGIPANATYGAQVSGDEPQYLLSAVSLGEDGDLDIADEIAERAYRPFHTARLDPQTLPLDDAGRQVSPHDPLLPAVLALPMRLGGWVAAKATLAALAGVLAALTAWVAVARFGVRRRVAIVVTGAFALTAPLATYATQVYPELPAALAALAVVAAATGPLRRPAIVLAAVGITALPWLAVKYVPVAAALAVLVLWRLRDRRRDLLTLAGGLAAMGVVYAVGHHVLYGSWTAYATGDHFAETGELSVVGTSPDYPGRSRRLVGLLVDDSFGLVAWMPLWLLAVPALAALVRRRPPGTDLLAAPAAAGWLVATFVALTMHGWWWPGRQVVVVLPLLVVAIAWWADRVTWRRAGVVAVAVGAGLGAATWVWTTIEAITTRRVLIVDFADTANPWFQLWRQVLPDGAHPVLADDLLTAGWVAVVVALAVAGWRSAAPSPTPPPGRRSVAVPAR